MTSWPSIKNIARVAALTTASMRDIRSSKTTAADVSVPMDSQAVDVRG